MSKNRENVMNDWYSRTVFFVKDTQRSLTFYVEKLGFNEDWTHKEEDKLIVAQVSRNGFEIILNKDIEKAGNGRIFISLHDEHVEPFRKEIKEKKISVSDKSWGMPVTEIVDTDGNELFFSPIVSSVDERKILLV